VLQVAEVRCQAGSKYGSGFKPRPKSDAGIYEIPLPRRWLRRSAGGTRTLLSRDNFRRPYRSAVTRASADLAA